MAIIVKRVCKRIAKKDCILIVHASSLHYMLAKERSFGGIGKMAVRENCYCSQRFPFSSVESSPGSPLFPKPSGNVSHIPRIPLNETTIVYQRHSCIYVCFTFSSLNDVDLCAAWTTKKHKFVFMSLSTVVFVSAFNVVACSPAFVFVE